VTKFPIINEEKKIIGYLFCSLQINRKKLFDEDKKRRVHTDNDIDFLHNSIEENLLSILIFNKYCTFNNFYIFFINYSIKEKS